LDSKASDTTTKSTFFYGYIVVLVSMVVMTMTFGVNYTFGVFFTPLRAEFGWTKAVTSAAYSILTFVAGFLGIFAGRLTDRFSAKVVSVAGGCFLGLGCILLSQISAAWQLYLIYGLVISAGIGGVWPSLTATVPKWFVVRRGLMSGIVVSGVGIGILVVPQLISRFIPEYGWRNSYIILGISSLAFIVTAAMFMRRDPHQRGQSLYGEERVRKEEKPERVRMLSYREMVHNQSFWRVCIIYFCFGISLHTVMVHIVPHAIETGIPLNTAAELIAVIGGSSILSKLVTGAISDRIGVKLSLAYNFMLLIGDLLWLQVAGSLWTLRAFAFGFGFAYGGIMTLQSVLSAELFGLGSLGLILGSVTFVYTIGSAVGPLLSGYIFDVTGSYSIAFSVCTILDVVALAVVLTTLGRRRVG
jgi:MFS family permease